MLPFSNESISTKDSNALRDNIKMLATHSYILLRISFKICRNKIGMKTWISDYDNILYKLCIHFNLKKIVENKNEPRYTKC